MARLRVGFKYPGDMLPPIIGSSELIAREYALIARAFADYKAGSGTIVHEIRTDTQKIMIWLDEVLFYAFEDSRKPTMWDWFIGRVIHDSQARDEAAEKNT